MNERLDVSDLHAKRRETSRLLFGVGRQEPGCRSRLVGGDRE